MLDMILAIISTSIILWYSPLWSRWRDRRAQARWEACQPPQSSRPHPWPAMMSYDIVNRLGQPFRVCYLKPGSTIPMATTILELRNSAGQRCGYARLGWLLPDRVVLAMIEVDEDYRGYGLGTAMLTRIIQLSREQGVQTIEGSIPWERRPWYERNGFAWHRQRGMLYDLTGGSILYPRTGHPWTEEDDRLVRLLSILTFYSIAHRAAELQRHPDEYIQRLQELRKNHPLESNDGVPMLIAQSPDNTNEIP